MEEHPNTEGRALGKGVTAFRLPSNWSPSTEVTVTAQEAVELRLETDQMDSVKRRLLIGFHAFGSTAINRIAVFTGISVDQAKKLMREPDVTDAIRMGRIPCWTSAELISRVAIIAEGARADKDRLAALKMLMEYRSMTAPEGGSRSFKRIAAKFGVPKEEGP